MGQIAKPTATEIALMNMRHFGKLSRLEERVGFSHDLRGGRKPGVITTSKT